MKAYRKVGEPEIWLIDKDGNKVAQCFPCTIECAVTTGDIRGGEGQPIVFEINKREDKHHENELYSED